MITDSADEATIREALWPFAEHRFELEKKKLADAALDRIAARLAAAEKALTETENALAQMRDAWNASLHPDGAA